MKDAISGRTRARMSKRTPEREKARRVGERVRWRVSQAGATPIFMQPDA